MSLKNIFLQLLISLLAVFLAAREGWSQAADPPPAVAQALRAANVPASAVALYVHELGAARPQLAHNARAAMNPASAMKLVTTLAGLELLGPTYRWRTEAWIAAPIADGVLAGDLTLKGTGDPRLGLENFWLLLRSLRGKGLRDLRGDLVLDRSHFERTHEDPSRFDGDGLRPYNVLPDALLVNFKSLRFRLVPEPARGAVHLFVEPRPPGFELVNGLRLADGPCPEGRALREQLKADFQHGTKPRAAFHGVFQHACGERDVFWALLSPVEYAGGVFRELWLEQGGAWSGVAREGLAPAGGRLLHVHESITLAEAVRDINKLSNNVMARQLYLTLAAEAAGPPARADAALRAVRAWLAQKNIDAPELVIENGSGLSRIERISAQSLGALLVAAFRGPLMPEFVSSLPIAGTDGTMRRRLKNDPVAGHAHIKTGALADVRALAGYVLDRSGRRHAVVFIANHPNAGATQAAQDAFLRWVWEQGSPAASPAPASAGR